MGGIREEETEVDEVPTPLAGETTAAEELRSRTPLEEAPFEAQIFHI